MENGNGKHSLCSSGGKGNVGKRPERRSGALRTAGGRAKADDPPGQFLRGQVQSDKSQGVNALWSEDVLFKVDDRTALS